MSWVTSTSRLEQDLYHFHCYHGAISSSNWADIGVAHIGPNVCTYLHIRIPFIVEGLLRYPCGGWNTTFQRCLPSPPMPLLRGRGPKLVRSQRRMEPVGFQIFLGQGCHVIWPTRLPRDQKLGSGEGVAPFPCCQCFRPVGIPKTYTLVLVCRGSMDWQDLIPAHRARRR